MILYIENPKDAPRKLIKLINKFSEIVSCKIHFHKSVAYLYIHSELSEREIKKATPFTIASKRIECPERNLTKEVIKTCTQKTIRY